MRVATILILLVLGACAAAAGSCNKGDLPCACGKAGGEWRQLKSPLEPTCTVKLQHQGRERSFNIFFPHWYTEDERYPVWVHMHGVYWSHMGDISSTMGYTVPPADATPVWDTMATGPRRKDAIIVYPQSTSSNGDPFKRTFWSLPFWRCSMGDCIDPNTDDIGYIEKIFNMLPERLSMNPSKLYLSGTSAGGMMMQNLLCNSNLVASKVAAAVDMIGGLGRPMEASCQPQGGKRVPLRIIHGDEDQVLHFDYPNDVDGSPFMSTRQDADMWKRLYNCNGESERQSWNDDTTTCTTLCPQQDHRLDLCRMRGVGHDLNKPYPGYPFTLAWDFLKDF